MNDKFRIDGHKLSYHIGLVHDWLEGKNIYPVYMEISPCGTCNHRCIYCALDFMEYRPRCLITSILKDRLREMGKLGVKSIMYAGEGEPFLHKDMPDIISATKRFGIDVAVTSNGVLFNKKAADETLPYLTWIKISINAAEPGTYEKIHRAKAGDLDKVIKNMSYAANTRRKNKYKCTLGMQAILLPDNFQEMLLLAKKAKAIGMDYLVVKPYSQHPLSRTTRFKDIKYGKYVELGEKLAKLNNADFNAIFRLHAMEKWDEARRNYKHCLALPFWAYIDAGGDVWGCSIYLTKNNFRLGNIYKDSFKGIWENKKHLNLVRWAKEKMNTAKCRVNCRMDEINRYLWDLTHPSEHVNFI